MHYLLRNMNFVEIEAANPVFKYGDEGDLFYIIIDGEVAVAVPGPYTLDGQNATQMGFLSWTLENFDDIHWPKLPRGTRLRSKLLTELQLLGVRINEDSFDAAIAKEAVTKAIEKGHTEIHTELYRAVSRNIPNTWYAKSKPELKINKLRLTTLLSNGDHFGELALRHGKPRAATIICTKKTKFATLARKDYKPTIAYAERRKMLEKV